SALVRARGARTAAVVEVLTSHGKSSGLRVGRVESAEFRPPQRPRDLLWRRVHMVVRDGPDGEVYLPTLYAGTHAAAEDGLRLGRATDWTGGGGAPGGGVGQRAYPVGARARADLGVKE